MPFQLEKVRIGHDGRGLGTGWYLEEVVIIVHDECWIFPCNQWLADYEDDGKTERDLFAGKFEIVVIEVQNGVLRNWFSFVPRNQSGERSKYTVGCSQVFSRAYRCVGFDV